MENREFTLTVNKAGIKAQGNLEIPSGFIYKGIKSGLSFNQEPSGVGYSGAFYINAESEEAIVLKNGLSQHPRGISANVGGLANGEGVVVFSGETVTINNEAFITNVKEQLATKLGCETTDIV